MAGIYENSAGRQRVINIALQQAYEGAHYMWGSRGNMPNANAPDCKFNKKNLNPATVSFCAAYTDRDGGPQVCGGRWKRKAVPDGCTNPTSASHPKLKEWIAENGHYSEIDWDNTLTPRFTKGVGVANQIVWGEGCDGTRHFDCISFVNWCLGKGNLAKFTFDMYHYFYSIEPKSGVISAMDVTDEDESKVLPADILLYGDIVSSPAEYLQKKIAEERTKNTKDSNKQADLDQADLDVIQKTSSHAFVATHHMPCIPTRGVGANIHHIGFATGKGDGRVHAMDTDHGVMHDKWGKVARRIRLPSSFFE